MSRPGHRLPPTSKRQRPISQPNDINTTTTATNTTTTNNNKSNVTHNVVLPQDTQFNLHDYINQYTGITRIHRLFYVAQHSTQLAVDALVHAITEIKQNRYNIILYNEAISISQTVLTSTQLQSNSIFQFDKQYVDTLTRISNQQLNRLEHQFSAAKKDGERDVLRTALLSLAEYYATVGDYNNAISKYLECREYIQGTDIQQQYSVIQNIIKCSIDAQTLLHVKNQVQRARTLSTITTDPVNNAQLYCAAGLYALKNESASTAVDQLIHVTTALGNTYNNVCVLRDIAMYTALCGLATYTRKQLKQYLLNNTEYQKLLDYTPEWKYILDNYYNNNHNVYISELQRLQPVLELDICIGHLVPKLIVQIRDTAIVNYILPYNNVRMNDMCTAFNITMDTLELTLTTLIKHGKLNARIDAVNHIVYTIQIDQRLHTFEKTLESGQKYIYDVQNMLLRYNLMDQEITVGDINKPAVKPGKTRKPHQDITTRGMLGNLQD